MRDLGRRLIARFGGLLYLGAVAAFARHVATVPASASPRAAHEETDARFVPVALVGLALLSMLAVGVVLVSWFYVDLTGRGVALHPPRGGLDDAGRPAVALPPPTAAPLRAEEARVLDSYGWVDRSAGVVRIPIDQAMRLVVERGLPARDGAPPGREAEAAGSAGGRFVEHPR